MCEYETLLYKSSKMFSKSHSYTQIKFQVSDIEIILWENALFHFYPVRSKRLLSKLCFDLD